MLFYTTCVQLLAAASVIKISAFPSYIYIVIYFLGYFSTGRSGEIYSIHDKLCRTAYESKI